MTNCKVFYSWQSDLPNCTNRGFIGKALENVVKSICNDDSIEVEPVVDRDTAGIPGAPDIASTIFTKIEQSQVFVCDVSLINKEAHRETKLRPTPNPNVLIELGYAIKTLSAERIIMVMNTAFGEPELLPFDLRMRRVITYNITESVEDKGTKRKELEKILKGGLNTIFTQQSTQQQSLTAAELELLYHAKETGKICILSTLAGKWIQAGEKDFVNSEDISYAAKYREALGSLLEKKLVTHDGGILYRLTYTGFKNCPKTTTAQ